MHGIYFSYCQSFDFFSFFPYAIITITITNAYLNTDYIVYSFSEGSMTNNHKLGELK
jgi:hypothetical protein